MLRVQEIILNYGIISEFSLYLAIVSLMFEHHLNCQLAYFLNEKFIKQEKKFNKFMSQLKSTIETYIAKFEINLI